MADKRWRVLIGSRSFGRAYPGHIAELEEGGCEVVPNGVGRAYRESELMEALPGMDAIITGTDELTAAVIRNASGLKTIAKHGVGLETIDLAAAREAGVVVSATPGAIQDAVADLTLGLLLAVARGIVSADINVKAGGWDPFFGFELRDKTLGIVGLGRIGKEVCLRAQAFGMTVVATDPYPDTDWAKTHQVTLVDQDELLALSDVVSLHAPAEATQGVLLDEARLSLMKQTAVLINTARGQLVDEAALAAALEGGRLAGAGLDAFVSEPPEGSPLLALPNVVLTPHLGGRTMEGQRRMGDVVIQNCLLALRGETPLYEVP